MNKKESGVVHLLLALKWSLCGLLAAVHHEAAFRHDLILVIVNLIGLWIIDAPPGIKFVVFCLGGLLLAVELLNSSIEAVVDLVSPGRHELAKRAKDMGSASVFCIIVLIVVGWIIMLACV